MLCLAKVISKLSKNSIIVKPIFPLDISGKPELVVYGESEPNEIIAVDISKKRKLGYYDNNIKNLFKEYRIFYKLSQKLDADDLNVIINLSKEYKLSQIEDMISKNEIQLKTEINYEFKFDVKIKLICKLQNGISEILKLTTLLDKYSTVYLGGGKYKITGVHNSNNQSEIIKIIKIKVRDIKYTDFEIYDFRTK